MKSAELIKLLNETSYPDEFLTSLEAVGFAIDAITEEGDSIFHLLALSKINYADDLSNYLELLLMLALILMYVITKMKVF